MLSKKDLAATGYEIIPDPDTPGYFYWEGNGEVSLTSFLSEADAMQAATDDAMATYDLHRCDACGKLYRGEDLLPVEADIDDTDNVSSGRCPDDNAFCYPMVPGPHWEVIKAHFGLHHAVCYTAEQAEQYVEQYNLDIEHEQSSEALASQAVAFLRRIAALQKHGEPGKGGTPFLPDDGDADAAACLMGLIDEARRIAGPAQATPAIQDEIAIGTTGKLVTLTGEEIVGTAEALKGTAGIISATRLESGKIEIDYDGQTNVDWDAQITATNANGEKLYVTASNNLVPESQVKLVEEN